MTILLDVNYDILLTRRFLRALIKVSRELLVRIVGVPIYVVIICASLLTCMTDGILTQKRRKKCSLPFLVEWELNERSPYCLGICLDIPDFSMSCLPRNHTLSKQDNICRYYTVKTHK